MNQRHRIFIAINLPADIKKKLEKYQGELLGLPIRWTNPKNIHITLVFLGHLLDEELLEVCKITKEVAQRNTSFSVNLKKICYGPPRISSGQAPRMVWITGEKSKDFTSLKNDLENSLLNSQKIRFSPENREFSPHITLGRIKQWEWRRIEPEERPIVEKEINLIFSVESIEVMESVLRRGGPEYTMIESYPLSI